MPPYQVRESGTIINTTSDKVGHSPVWTFHVHRLSNWGWELRSEYIAVRPYRQHEDLEELWDDYLDELIYQDSEEGVSISREGAEGTTRRIVPRSMADKLVW